MNVLQSAISKMHSFFAVKGTAATDTIDVSNTDDNDTEKTNSIDADETTIMNDDEKGDATNDRIKICVQLKPHQLQGLTFERIEFPANKTDSSSQDSTGAENEDSNDDMGTFEYDSDYNTSF